MIVEKVTVEQLRSSFLNFFASKGHTIVPSSPLIPINDKTLLFTNSGMVQFKEIFLGNDKRAYSRATSAQCCIRAGGKHNDLENVGYTARHHTFFEMLGNFSFGDYFKVDAIKFAWEFLTVILKLPKEKLWITVYKDDDEAFDIWVKEIGVSPSKISRCDDKDNFWSMGDTGPCGPCTEIFYDHGESVAGGPPGSADADGDRYIEIWNLVFMQYNRDAAGTLTKLPKQCVDTGMGLERVSAVLQHVHNNYEIDIFQHIIISAAKTLQVTDLSLNSLKILADHIRSVSFLIAQDVLPSNEGQGYVLRRIMRRAIRHGGKLGAKEPFLHKLVISLVEVMGDAYPLLQNKKEQIIETILQEEIQFSKTLDQGLKILEQDIAVLNGKEIPGTTLFKLYDTYGFPVDLTQDIARERGFTVDEIGFEKCMQEQRERARSAGKFSIDYSSSFKIEEKTVFTGYTGLTEHSFVTQLFSKDGNKAGELKNTQDGMLLLESTPFYAESGGQVGDIGTIVSANGAVFFVSDVKKNNDAHVHYGKVTSGKFNVGDKIVATVDANSRMQIAANHSATHLLHAALCNVLGDGVAQKGSLVDASRLRFDFSYARPVTADQLLLIERLVNTQILLNGVVKKEELAFDEAKKRGAMALFGEKYGDKVRVISIGDSFSVELCGGTHVAYTGDIGLFKITSEASIASGVRRIEAITHETAYYFTQQSECMLKELYDVFATNRDSLLNIVKEYVEKQRKLEKELQKLYLVNLANIADGLIIKAVDMDGIKFISSILTDVAPADLRSLIDNIKSKLLNAVIVLAVVKDGRVSVIVSVSPNWTIKVGANEIIGYLSDKINGKGGGNKELAQAGGSNIEALPSAINGIFSWIKEQISR